MHVSFRQVNNLNDVKYYEPFIQQIIFNETIIIIKFPQHKSVYWVGGNVKWLLLSLHIQYIVLISR